MSIAVASDEIATESVHARLAGDDVDDASRCIASIEAALRALQDFDALDIGQAVDHRTIDLRYIVDKGSDTRIGAEEDRSEEHTSELQSLMRISYAVFCLKKYKKN